MKFKKEEGWRTAADTSLELGGIRKFRRTVGRDTCKNGCPILKVSAGTRSIVAVRGR